MPERAWEFESPPRHWMQKFLQIFILASSVLIFSTSLALTLSQTAVKTLPKVSAQEVYKDEKGDLKYAEGNCKVDSDCFVGGCSSELCTNVQGAISICIYSPDFPDKSVYECGCWEQKCAWIKQ